MQVMRYHDIFSCGRRLWYGDKDYGRLEVNFDLKEQDEQIIAIQENM